MPSTVNAALDASSHVYDRPCAYCGTMLDADEREENHGIAEAGPGPIAHHLVSCRERVAAALRAEKRAHLACRGALKRAAQTLGDFGIAIEHPIWEVLEEVGII